ncbi:hypothetical protein EQ856_10315 [Enterococcus hirae]|nr:hypothetical protein EQ857_13925 [Enterococcus hirae]RXA77194.1 hypothetical protein EQ856_10315 [Enterococcus hirae]
MNSFNLSSEIILLINLGPDYIINYQLKSRMDIIFGQQKIISVFLLKECSYFLVPFLDISKPLKTLIYQRLFYFPS